MICPTCSCELPAIAKYCVKCGSRIEFASLPTQEALVAQEHAAYCVNCGRPCQPGDHFCGSCGHKVGSPGASGAVAVNISGTVSHYGANAVQQHQIPTSPEQAYPNGNVAPRSIPLAPSPDLTVNKVDPEFERLRAEYPNLEGVGGWLLWFCVATAVITPLVCLAEVFNSKDPLVWIIDIGLSGWCVFTAVTIGKRGKRALRYVAILFIIYFFIGALTIVGAVMGADTKSSESNMMTGFRVLISLLIWYLYFHSSKRVRLTLGGNL